MKNVIPQYSEANTKKRKTIIINAILEEIRKRGSPEGGFIMKNLDGQYWEVKNWTEVSVADY
jgi:hypothetical protein